MPYPDKDALTPDIESQLKQGTKVFFKKSESNIDFVGFIEVDEWGEKFFVAEHNYDVNGNLKFEGMRYYNRLKGMSWHSEFKILD